MPSSLIFLEDEGGGGAQGEGRGERGIIFSFQGSKVLATRSSQSTMGPAL
jgi:hypothetical protein